MKQKRVLFLGILFIFPNFKSVLISGETSQKINQLHQEIGKELILIRKDNLDLGSRIYPLLDQVSLLSNIARTSIKKKKEMKLAFNQEQVVFNKIKEENNKLKEEVMSLKSHLASKNSQCNTYQQKLCDLTEERNNLIKKASEIDSKEKEFASRLKELEITEAKQKEEIKPS